MSLDVEKQDLLNSEQAVQEIEEFEDKSFELLTSLSPIQQRFIHLYITGQYTIPKLAQLLDVHPNTIMNWLKNARVKSTIEEMQVATHQVVTHNLKALTLKAANKLNQLIDSPIDGVALQAVKDVLDRSGHKAKTEIKVDKTVRTFEEKLGQLINDTIVDAEFEVVEEE